LVHNSTITLTPTKLRVPVAARKRFSFPEQPVLRR
jgi:hypothetical protein